MQTLRVESKGAQDHVYFKSIQIQLLDTPCGFEKVRFLLANDLTGDLKSIALGKNGVLTKTFK